MPRGALIVPVGAMHVTKLLRKDLAERTPCQSSPALEITFNHSSPTSTLSVPMLIWNPFIASSAENDSSFGKLVGAFPETFMPAIFFSSSFITECIFMTLRMLPFISGYFVNSPSIAERFALTV